MSDWGTNFLKRFLEKIENMSDAELDQMMSQEVVYNVIKTPLEHAKEIIEIYTKKKEEMEAGRDWMDAFVEIFKSQIPDIKEKEHFCKTGDNIFFVLNRTSVDENNGYFEVSSYGRIHGLVERETTKVKYFFFFTQYLPRIVRTKLTLLEALEAVAEIVILQKSIKYKML